jgi:hypothetical protein
MLLILILELGRQRRSNYLDRIKKLDYAGHSDNFRKSKRGRFSGEVREKRQNLDKLIVRAFSVAQ